VRIGIDIGGTFTDLVRYDPASGAVETSKRLSTPDDPSAAVLAGLGDEQGRREIVHGSTVATNALLEHKGASTALITTRGFRDVLQIGRQDRPALYDLLGDVPAALVPRRWRFEVDERVDSGGRVLKRLDPAEAQRLIPLLLEEGIDSVAVCLLFSFLHPAHEETIAAMLRAAGLSASASCEILPEFREYERTSTTVVNAYVSPVMDRYLTRLAAALAGDELRIMQSNGGSISAAEARRNAVRCILSGPAGGVVGAQAVGQAAGLTRLITFDMGGTSTDVSLVDGVLRTTTEATVGGYPLRIPILDIHTVGSGGGSLAGADLGGALRVGPASAGADPGPACYGRGDQPTVTDANLVLGRLAPDFFLGGEMPLDAARAWNAVGRLAGALDLSPEACAMGIVAVANARMARALRVISVERGQDPRHFTLVSFGGAGGLHASDLARGLGIPQVLISPYASTLSALGMVMADVVKDYTQTVMVSGETPTAELAARLQPLMARASEELQAEGVGQDEMVIEPALDVRYQGQSYELPVPFGPDALERFHFAHQRLYGYADRAAPVEVVNVRVRAVGRVARPVLRRHVEAGPDPAAALIDRRSVLLADGRATVPFYRGEDLAPGNQIAGPAVVVRSDTTVLLQPADRATVDPTLNLRITVGCRGT
jgi:N-methylhydantoinase A